MNSSMSGKLDFRQSRASAAAAPVHGGKKAAGSTPSAAPPQQQPSQAEQQAEADEAALRQFDLDSRFGPCSGITRLERWERAAKLGLAPPADVPELVRRHGEDSDFNKDLFYPGKV
ncbi:DNA polymerase delta subunit 4 [Micractinium conductrix]|uniref:DNA polymerase delta subunit 4 n=1 Tax=Micractinium conductrix TaxID=554055 RepID=A0A2P6VGH8_9CHLO|nr:DNA polymerase delta subunit 4 [Micractinium conductrix]|eukprot:PSC73196.1 DNA polymerase delta subunit 4 [Micractinium conductrix]